MGFWAKLFLDNKIQERKCLKRILNNYYIFLLVLSLIMLTPNNLKEEIKWKKYTMIFMVMNKMSKLM